jgi:hypothetical protein
MRYVSTKLVSKSEVLQIQKMVLIYYRASRVLIWLGEGNPETDAMMDIMQDLHNGHTPRTRHNSASAIFSREWWRRVWSGHAHIAETNDLGLNLSLQASPSKSSFHLGLYLDYRSNHVLLCKPSLGSFRLQHIMLGKPTRSFLEHHHAAETWAVYQHMTVFPVKFNHRDEH